MQPSGDSGAVPGALGRDVFQVDLALLEESATALSSDTRLHWLLGGSGSGKTTVCRELVARYGVTVIDMDARIYGSYHARFSPSRHPVSYAWSTAENGLAWLLDLSCAGFDAFNHASFPEYLDLLVHELQSLDDPRPIVADGGICTPALLASVLDPSRVLCLERTGLDTAALWAEAGPRAQMRDAVLRLDASGEKLERFLEFDACINATLAAECTQAGIRVCAWTEQDSSCALADRVAREFGFSASGESLGGELERRATS